MTLPERITLIRHGESEANIAQRLVKTGRHNELPETFATRHDSAMRLSLQGVSQARQAGLWMKTNNEIPLDRFYVSPHVRTRETAAELGLNGSWLVDDRFRERDWGEIVSHEPMNDEIKRFRSMNEYYWKPPGGESRATGLRLRVESIMNTLYRRANVNHVLAVTHGEFIRQFQIVAERITPDSANLLDEDENYKIHNTMIVQYSSVNPKDATEKHNHFKWRRAICPWDRSLDWDNGEWVYGDAVRHTDSDLLSYVDLHPPLLGERLNTEIIPIIHD